jgi:hypothetical protein
MKTHKERLRIALWVLRWGSALPLCQLIPVHQLIGFLQNAAPHVPAVQRVAMQEVVLRLAMQEVVLPVALLLGVAEAVSTTTHK